MYQRLEFFVSSLVLKIGFEEFSWGIKSWNILNFFGKYENLNEGFITEFMRGIVIKGSNLL